jgi:shikimate 5-dehydrogenase
LVEVRKLAYDWPIERGSHKPNATPRYLSLHERAPGQSLVQALSRFPLEVPVGTELKAALPTHDFLELRSGHEWREALPTARIFLPMSDDGRWSFYRLLMSRKQSLGFFRESDGSSSDQPTLLQWLRLKPGCFAAILGDPVCHSRTPMEHYGFFASRAESVLAVRISEFEWREERALEFLQMLGLRHAAVTAPLKTAAFQSCRKHDEVATRLGSVNTMLWLEEKRMWSGANTDLIGLQRAVDELRSVHPYFGPIAVWGGGGTLATAKTVFEGAEFFSARSGENRIADRVTSEQFRPDTVVWGVGRGRGSDVRPPVAWKPKQIIDLNYSDDSPGREYALTIPGCRYVSGLGMFRAQAEAQRNFWESQ